MSLGLLTLQIAIPGCSSLKQKRSRIKPLIQRIRREFNASVVELGYQDVWDQALIGCAVVSNETVHTQKTLQKIVSWIENNRFDLELVNEQVELF